MRAQQVESRMDPCSVTVLVSDGKAPKWLTQKGAAFSGDKAVFYGVANIAGTRNPAMRRRSCFAGDSALVRTVEMRLNDDATHLLQIAVAFQSAEYAVTACRKRFKNLPDRYFTAVETLISLEFDRTKPGAVEVTTVVERST